MPTTKPTKPSITLPPAFGTSPSNVKTPYTAQELVDGYSASIQQILDGGNVNWLNDTFFKFLTYTTAICDWLNGTPTKKIPFINSSNQLDYMDAPVGNIIGTILAINCTSSYIPDGCLPCDGHEYTKAMFGDLWTNFLTSSPAKLNVCTYEQYESDILTYGQCGKFAIDNENETFKVPTIKDGSYLTQAKSDSELGKAYNESLPNIKGTFGAASANTNVNGAFYGINNEGTCRDIGGSYSYQRRYYFGASSSSSVYQDDAPVQGNNVRVRYFIVVSNGQLNQAQMDWSAWATETTAIKNATNFTPTGKSTIVGWGMPDYSAGVSLTSGSSYTAPCDGIVRASGNGTNVTTQIMSVDDASTLATTQTTGYFTIWAFVKKGMQYKVTGNQHCEFFPLKGVQND